MEYRIVSHNGEEEFADKINALLVEGWELYGPLIDTQGMLSREMVRHASDPERAKLAADIAESIENMSLGALFHIEGSSGSQFEVKRVK